MNENYKTQIWEPGDSWGDNRSRWPKAGKSYDKLRVSMGELQGEIHTEVNTARERVQKQERLARWTGNRWIGLERIWKMEQISKQCNTYIVRDPEEEK